MKEKNFNVQPAALLAELLGTFVLTSVALLVGDPIVVAFTLVALVIGLGVVSGAHVNPAVSFGLWSARKISAVRMLTYMAMQFTGAVGALIVAQLFKGNLLAFNISWASFSSFDAKVLFAELIGTAILTFGVAAAVYYGKIGAAAKGLIIGFSLMGGLLVGSQLLKSAVQQPASMEEASKGSSHVEKVGGVVLNPAVAFAVTEKDSQSSAMMSQLGSTPKASSTPATRLNLELIIGTLIGGVLGVQLYAFCAGVNPFKREEDSDDNATTKTEAAAHVASPATRAKATKTTRVSKKTKTTRKK